MDPRAWIARVAMALFGALPASVLAYAAARLLFSIFTTAPAAEMMDVLFAVWALLGIAGAAGLWLALFDRRSRAAFVLVACGLVADGILLGILLSTELLKAMLNTRDGPWLFAMVAPFIVGAIYLAQAARRAVRRRQMIRAAEA